MPQGHETQGQRQIQFYSSQRLNSASSVLLCIVPSFLHDVTAPVLIAIVCYFGYARFYRRLQAGCPRLLALYTTAIEEQRGALGNGFTAINTTQPGPFFTLDAELFVKNNGLFSSPAGAVVIAFVVCWLPYHIRRLMFCYVPSSHWTE